ncbi:hypothetical protein L9F63_003714, partial [Diploptera punctata]
MEIILYFRSAIITSFQFLLFADDEYILIDSHKNSMLFLPIFCWDVLIFILSVLNVCSVFLKYAEESAVTMRHKIKFNTISFSLILSFSILFKCPNHFSLLF